jgi:hypothetical protein
MSPLCLNRKTVGASGMDDWQDEDLPPFVILLFPAFTTELGILSSLNNTVPGGHIAQQYAVLLDALKSRPIYARPSAPTKPRPQCQNLRSAKAGRSYVSRRLRQILAVGP